MNMRFLTVSAVVLAIFVVVIIDVARQHFLSPKRSTASTKLDETSGLANSVLLSDSRLIAFNRWSTERKGNPNLSYVIRTSTDQDCSGSGVKLTILNNAGVTIHEDRFCGIDSIYPRDILRTGMPQLIVEANLGGNQDFLGILAYQDGKVIDLTREIESDFGSHAEVRPQFRSGVRPAVEPYQIMLTAAGLASSEEKYTSVYRYKDGAYKRVGEFSATKADNLLEQLMTATNKGQHRSK
jgi:hypothetical protein